MVTFFVALACVLFHHIDFAASALSLVTQGTWMGATAPTGVVPAGSYSSSFTLDPADSNTCILFDGGKGIPAVVTSQLRKYTVSPPGWQKDVPPRGAVPGTRYENSVATGGPGNSTVYFAGNPGGGINGQYNDTYYYLSAANSLTRVAAVGLPHGREAHTAIIHNDVMIVFGGEAEDNVAINSIYRFNFSGNGIWNITDASGTAPSVRSHHTAVKYIFNGVPKMIVYGGALGDDHTGTSVRNDVGIYDIESHSWDTVAPATFDGDPDLLRRNGHSAVLTAYGTMLVFGGLDVNGTALSTVYEYNIVANSWTAVNTTGTPATARAFHSAVMLPPTGNGQEMMLIYGGLTSTVNTTQVTLGDVFQLAISLAVEETSGAEQLAVSALVMFCVSLGLARQLM